MEALARVERELPCVARGQQRFPARARTSVTWLDRQQSQIERGIQVIHDERVHDAMRRLTACIDTTATTRERHGRLSVR